jgi:hypothetical protein
MIFYQGGTINLITIKQTIISYLFFIPMLFVDMFSSINAQGLEGMVVDKESLYPVDSAMVRYGDAGGEFVYSDRQGKFSIPMQPQKKIVSLHIQRKGYEDKIQTVTDRGKELLILLEKKPIELQNVEVTYTFANTLLEKALYNTKRRLITEQEIFYSGHVIQAEETHDERQESVFTYTTNLKPYNLRKVRIPFIFKLIKRTNIQTIPHKPASILLRKTTIRFHLDEFDYKIKESLKVVYSTSTDDSLFILTATPKNRQNTSTTFYINKADTTLSYYAVYPNPESDENAWKSIGNYKYKRNKSQSHVRFDRIKDSFFISSTEFFFEVILEGKNTYEKMIVQAEIKATDPQTIDKDKGEKIQNSSKELFRTR